MNSLEQWIALWWIVFGLIIGIFSILDFLDRTKLLNNSNNWGYIEVGLIGTVFFLLDIVIWPLYIISKLIRWLWRLRGSYEGHVIQTHVKNESK
jgi:hypothetical protein